MAGDELGAWNWGHPVDAAHGVANPANFNQDFNQFPNNIQAVVISADPLLHENRIPLINAANNSGYYICYPVLSYRNNVPPANQPNSPYAASGPALAPPPNGTNLGGYYYMGVMAANILNNTNLNQTVYPVPPGPVNFY
jgi:hypothetical protein